MAGASENLNRTRFPVSSSALLGALVLSGQSRHNAPDDRSSIVSHILELRAFRDFIHRG